MNNFSWIETEMAKQAKIYQLIGVRDHLLKEVDEKIESRVKLDKEIEASLKEAERINNFCYQLLNGKEFVKYVQKDPLTAEKLLNQGGI